MRSKLFFFAGPAGGRDGRPRHEGNRGREADPGQRTKAKEQELRDRDQHEKTPGKTEGRTKPASN
ncbi:MULTISPECIES: hypothetical protein [unclassified Microcoleus]|uniref:hypothetical protein n=1 Tax=unclassified Microcoleus TaxID=2642155 RepID=UPI002FD4ABE4